MTSSRLRALCVLLLPLAVVVVSRSAESQAATAPSTTSPRIFAPDVGDSTHAGGRIAPDTLSAGSDKAPSTLPSLPTSASSAKTAEVQSAAQDWLSRLTINGRAYLRYSHEIGDARKDFSEFAIDRLYLGLSWQLWDRARLRYTLDGGATRVTDVSLSNGSLQKSSNGSLTFVTKHLYFEYLNLLGAQSYFRAGLAPLPFLPFEEDVWGYRLQGTSFTDRSGYLTTTDLGISLGGVLPDSYGSWAVALVNGEGWRRSEAGEHKDWHARLTVAPFAAMDGPISRVNLTAFRSDGINDDISTGPRTRDRTILFASYKDAGRLSVGAEMVWTTDPTSSLVGRYPSLVARPQASSRGDGTSVFLTATPALFNAVGMATKFELIARLDQLDPDDRIPDNDVRRIIGGVAYQAHPNMKVLFNVEDVSYGALAMRTAERRLMLQTEIRY